MSRLTRLCSVNDRQRLAILALVVLVLSAGCLGLGNSDGDDPEMDDNGTQDDPGGEANSTDGGSAELELPATADEWQSQFDGIDPGGDADADALASDVVETIDGVESYEFDRATVTEQQSGGDVTETTTEQSVRIDVTNERAAYTLTATQGDREGEGEGYLADLTIYERTTEDGNLSETEWVKQEVGANYEDYFQQLHPLGGFGTVLEDSSVAVVGTATVGGADTTVLSVNASADALAAATGVNAAEAAEETRLLLWVDQESGEVRRAASYTRLSQTQGDDEMQTIIVNDYRFEFVPVDFEIPEEALNADSA